MPIGHWFGQRDVNHNALSAIQRLKLIVVFVGGDFLRQGLKAMPLKLSLRPGEKFVLNGAVVQNGDRRGTLVLQNKASVLREKDIMQEEEVTTPARRIYFATMMMYLDEGNAQKYYDEFVLRISEFMGVISNPAILAECVNISRYAMTKEYYKALLLCRKLMDYEEERLAHVAPSLPEGSSAG